MSLKCGLMTWQGSSPEKLLLLDSLLVLFMELKHDCTGHVNEQCKSHASGHICDVLGVHTICLNATLPKSFQQFKLADMVGIHFQEKHCCYYAI